MTSKNIITEYNVRTVLSRCQVPGPWLTFALGWLVKFSFSYKLKCQASMISLACKCRHISSLRSRARISWAPHHSLECTIGFSFSPWESISSVWCTTVHVNLLHVHVHVDRFYYKIHKFDPLMQFTVYIFLLTYRKRRDNCIHFVLSLKLQCLIYTESFWEISMCIT